MKRPYFHYFIYIFLCSFVSRSYCSESLYKHLTTCSHNDFELIANALFFSHQRAYTTLRLNQASIEHLITINLLQDSLEKTRRNPSKPLTYTLTPEEIQKTQQNYLSVYTVYCSTILCYKNCINTLLVDNKELFDHAASYEILETIRHQARKTISTALGYQLITLRHLLTAFYQQWNTKSQELHYNKEKNIKFLESIFHTLVDSLPSIGVQAFSYFDNEASSLTQKARSLLHNATNINNFLWDTIETARALFYKDLCSLVVRIGYERNFEKDCYVLFDEKGLLENHSTLLLPLIASWIS